MVNFTGCEEKTLFGQNISLGKNDLLPEK